MAIWLEIADALTQRGIAVTIVEHGPLSLVASAEKETWERHHASTNTTPCHKR
jgi:hypothetical protein